MRKESLLQNYFKDTFSFMHKKRHQICKMDRLLGNKHLHREIRTIYKAINKLTMVSSLSVICVDWSCLSYADGVYLLRASIKIHGRSLVCYQEVHPKEHENNEIAHNLFLDNLKMTVPENVTPVIVTDAIFSPLWFKKVTSLGWHFIGRVRVNRGNYFNGEEWCSVKKAYEQASSTPYVLVMCD